MQTDVEEIPLPGFMPDEAGADAEQAGGAVTAPPPAGPGAASGVAGTEARDPGDMARLAGLVRQREEEQRARWLVRVDAWRDEVARDAELGGERLEASIARAQLALGRFDESGRIGRLLQTSGYGNHPDIVRFFNRLADAVMEDVPAPGSPEGGMAPLEERMYADWHS